MIKGFNLKGRTAKHCSKFQKSDFTNRFIFYSTIIAFSFYLGIFIKVYIINKISFTWLSPISFAPFIVFYWKELITEHVMNKANLKKRLDHLSKMI